MKRKRIIAGLLLIQGGLAFAAEPSLVGTWEATSGYWSSTGTETNPAPAEFSQKPVQQRMIIQAQQGKAFHGTTIRYNGEHRQLAGVIGIDGKSIFISIDYGTGSGVLAENGTQMSYCATTIELTRNFALCTTFEKVK